MRAFLEELARCAGAVAAADYSRLDPRSVETKSSVKDIVTFADREVEDFILSRIRARFPGDSFFGEERGRSGTGEVCWIIDPIDGTSSFERGQPYYSVSIAREERGVLTHGAVYAPRLGELFYAERGGGAFLNGKPIGVSHRSRLVECTFSAGTACLRANLPRNVLPALCEILPKAREHRRGGSAALDCCMVAAGRLDFYWEFPLALYDVAAGGLIAREAGATVTDFDGGEEWPEKGLIVSTPEMYEVVRELLRRHDYR